MAYSCCASANENIAQQELETITVVAIKGNGIKISSTAVVNLPGTANDPIKGLEALPGVILAPSNSGSPIAEPAIRGSSSQDNLYLTDGLDMGYVFHNDGASVYNPLLIESFELKTAAWQPNLTNANGGVILTQLRDAGSLGNQTVLDLGLYRSGFLYEKVLSESFAYYLSYRESLVHIYVDNFIEDEEFSFAVPPRNRDYQAKFNWQLSDQDSLIFAANGAKDYIEIAFDENGRDINKNPDLKSGERYENYYHSQAISWQRYNQEYDSSNSINFLQQKQQEREGDIFSWQADIANIIIRSDTRYYADNFTFAVGGLIKSTKIDYFNSGRLLPCNTEFEICPVTYFSDKFSDQGDLSIVDYSIYSNIESDLTPTISSQLGAAFIGSDLNDEQYLEPRIRVLWQLYNNHQLHFAYGVHHTWVNDYRLLANTLGNKKLHASKSNQIVIGLNTTLSKNWQLSTELYYKDFSDLVIANPLAQKRNPHQIINPSIETYLNVASGDSYGAELMLNKSFSEDWLGWLSIAYSKTERDNPLIDKTFNSEFDLPWVVNLVLNYQINQQWTAGFKWRFQSGRRYTAVNSATPYYEQGQQDPLFYIPEYDSFNASSVKNYHRLDLRIDYKTQLMGLDSSIYFELMNVYASKAIQEFEYNKDYSSYEKDYQFPDMPLPSVGMTLNF